jgi:hypothetical protein
MKNNFEVILFAALFAIVGFRLYKKFFQKDSGQNNPAKKSGSSFSSYTKDDDYEPYSKK